MNKWGKGMKKWGKGMKKWGKGMKKWDNGMKKWGKGKEDVRGMEGRSEEKGMKEWGAGRKGSECNERKKWGEKERKKWWERNKEVREIEERSEEIEVARGGKSERSGGERKGRMNSDKICLLSSTKIFKSL